MNFSNKTSKKKWPNFCSRLNFHENLWRKSVAGDNYRDWSVRQEFDLLWKLTESYTSCIWNIWHAFKDMIIQACSINNRAANISFSVITCLIKLFWHTKKGIIITKCNFVMAKIITLMIFYTFWFDPTCNIQHAWTTNYHN